MSWGLILVCWCCAFKPFFFCFIHHFSPIPVVQSSLMQNPIFLHTTTALPLPACLSLSPPTLQEVWRFPQDTFSCWFFTQLIRGAGNACLTASPLEERLKNRRGLQLAMKLFWFSKLATICSGNTTEIHAPSFRPPPPPELACKLALAGSLLLSSCVGC